jgi:Hemerythrin HHE cation binding domain
MGGPKTLNPVIHAAVRRDLARLHDALGRANDGDAARANQLELAYANLHRQLQHHHQSEDRFIYPFVARIEPSPELMRAMDDEHHAMADRTFLRSAVPPPVTFLLSRLGGRTYHRDVAPAWKDSSADSQELLD